MTPATALQVARVKRSTVSDNEMTRPPALTQHDGLY